MLGPPKQQVPRPGTPRQRPPAASRLSWCHRRPAHLGGNRILLVREQGARGHTRGAAALHPALLSGQSSLQPPACKPSGASGPPTLSPPAPPSSSSSSSAENHHISCVAAPASPIGWALAGGNVRSSPASVPARGRPFPPGLPGPRCLQTAARSRGHRAGHEKWKKRGFCGFCFVLGFFSCTTLAQLRWDAGCQQLDLDPHGCVTLPARSIFRMTETQHICSARQSRLPACWATPRGSANPPQHQLHGCSSSHTTGTVAARRDDA